MRSALFAVLIVLAIGNAAYGQTSTVSEWKYFGSVPSVPFRQGKLPAAYLFYDAKGVRQLPDHHLSVWAKGLAKKEVNSFAEQKNEAMKALAAKKISDYYAPPIAEFVGVTPDKDWDSYISFVFWEVIADNAQLQPVSRVLYEINCAEQTNRALSVQVFAGPTKEPISDEQAGVWEHAAPETNSGYLIAILCKNR